MKRRHLAAAALLVAITAVLAVYSSNRGATTDDISRALDAAEVRPGLDWRTARNRIEAIGIEVTDESTVAGMIETTGYFPAIHRNPTSRLRMVQTDIQVIVRTEEGVVTAIEVEAVHTVRDPSLGADTQAAGSARGHARPRGRSSAEPSPGRAGGLGHPRPRQ